MTTIVNSNVRQRKQNSGSQVSKDVDTGICNDHELIQKIESLWVSSKEISKEEYIHDLLHSVDHNKRKSKSAFNRCLKVFDCVWTVVLIVFVIGCCLYFFPVLFNFISTHGHYRFYDVTRWLRFAYIALQPYILLDLSHTCIISNPFGNNSLNCPCIEMNEPITVQHTPGTPLSSDVFDSSRYYVNLIRTAVPISSDYGRNTLAQVYKTTNLLPELCSQYVLENTNIHVNYYSLGTDERYWNELQTMKELWSFSWLECTDSDPSMWPLLPDHHHLLSEGNWTETASFFMVSSQWAPSATPFCEDADGRMLLVLKGTLQIFIDPASELCTESCMSYSTRELLTLSEGDALIYNVKYWIISDKTWSNTSFAVFSCLHF